MNHIAANCFKLKISQPKLQIIHFDINLYVIFPLLRKKNSVLRYTINYFFQHAYRKIFKHIP